MAFILYKSSQQFKCEILFSSNDTVAIVDLANRLSPKAIFFIWYLDNVRKMMAL